MDNYKSGFVTLLGRPNVGKSTLVNKLIGQKIAITSTKAQTTRNKLKGILTTQTSQIIFIDTPGIHKPHHLLGQRLVNNAKSAIGGVDLLLLILDSNQQPGRGDSYIRDFLIKNKSKGKFIAVLNKWDLLEENDKKLRMKQYNQLIEDKLVHFLPVSAITGEGCKDLVKLIENFLPVGPMLYPKDTISDQPLNILLSELIREQVLYRTKEEIPHSVAVKIEKLEIIERKDKRDLTAILATIIVERKSQKGILIGKGGGMLKEIGASARKNMMKLIEGPIYLELFVKVVPNWRKKESKLNEFGYEED